jgi:uncharacterized protein
MEYKDEIEIVIKDQDFDPAGKILISGFHSALGETGYIVLRHLAAQEGVRPVGCITSPLTPPHLFVGGGRLLMPIELYSFADRFILLFPRVQPHRAEWSTFAEVVADWAVEQHLREAVLLGGLDVQFAAKGDEWRCAYTKTYKCPARNFQLPILEEGRGIYGPLALLLGNFELRDFPAIAVLPFAERGRPDPRAASFAIKILNRFYNLTVNTDELMRDAEAIEREIRQLLERQNEQEPDRGFGGMFV